MSHGQAHILQEFTDPDGNRFVQLELPDGSRTFITRDPERFPQVEEFLRSIDPIAQEDQQIDDAFGLQPGTAAQLREGNPQFFRALQEGALAEGPPPAAQPTAPVAQPTPAPERGPAARPPAAQVVGAGVEPFVARGPVTATRTPASQAQRQALFETARPRGTTVSLPPGQFTDEDIRRLSGAQVRPGEGVQLRVNPPAQQETRERNEAQMTAEEAEFLRRAREAGL